MNFDEVMQRLEELGTAQNVKVYKRHGAGDDLFGVSFANLNELKKQIKVDHKLAAQLWKTGNSDARTLALMIADPSRFTATSADAWLKDISYYLLADMFAGLIAQTDLALPKYRKWSRSRKEYVRQTGYSVLCSLLRDRPSEVDNELCRECLKTVEQQIHKSPNRARHTMNGALISIGVYKPALRRGALAVARRVGKIDVDHGQTNCETPDAESCISTVVEKSGPKRNKAGVS